MRRQQRRCVCVCLCGPGWVCAVYTGVASRLPPTPPPCSRSALYAGGGSAAAWVCIRGGGSTHDMRVMCTTYDMHYREQRSFGCVGSGGISRKDLNSLLNGPHPRRLRPDTSSPQRPTPFAAVVALFLTYTHTTGSIITTLACWSIKGAGGYIHTLDTPRTVTKTTPVHCAHVSPTRPTLHGASRTFPNRLLLPPSSSPSSSSKRCRLLPKEQPARVVTLLPILLRCISGGQ